MANNRPARLLIPVAIALLVLLLVGRGLAVFYTEVLWFRDLGFLAKAGVETKAARDTAAFVATPPAPAR